MRILVGCEYSNIVASAFRLKGHEVYSCDIIDNDFPSSFHLTMDIFEAIKIIKPDMLIAHPPCTYLCKAQYGLLKHEAGRYCKMLQAVEFVKRIYAADIKQIAIENPIGILFKMFRRPDQIIRPWHFGDIHNKDICLWLKNLPPIISTVYNTKRIPVRNHVNGQMTQEQKSKIKSKFFPLVAEAMANQWG